MPIGPSTLRRERAFLRACAGLLASMLLLTAPTACALPIIGATPRPPKPRAAKAVQADVKAAASTRPARKQQKKPVANADAQRAQPASTAAARARKQAEAAQAPAPTPRYALSTARPAAARAEPTTCYGKLDAAGIAYERVAPSAAHGVQLPTRLAGPIGGVEIVAHDKRAPQHQAVLDCRLALAMLSWSPTLRRAGVARIEHYSIYRPGSRVGGTGKKSGHSRGMALDAARFHLKDGRVVDVLTDWEDRGRGDAPCPLRSDEAWASRLLRSLVCEAVDQNLFQVVITPHHDAAHENHVHLELRPEVSWTYVR